MWATVSTCVAILGIILGIARWIAAHRKAKVDAALGAARAENVALRAAVEAGQERIETDAKVVNLPDADADKRLAEWMRD